MSVDKQYWAGKEISEFCKEAEGKVERFYEWIRTSGRLALWQKMVSEYYAGAFSLGSLGTAGDQDEFTTIKENHLHSLGEHVVVMVTGSRPAFEPKAKNTDTKTIAQVELGGALLDQAFREKDLEGVNIECVRYCGMFGESYGFCGWDPNAGEPYANNPDTGRNEKTGDLLYGAWMPIDVVRDVTKYNAYDHQWLMPRRQMNRYDLAARYPELADRIMAVPSTTTDESKRPRMFTPAREAQQRMDSDDVTVWYFYHEPSDALPQGRYVEWISADLWLFDGPLPYPWIPIERMAGEEMAGSAMGYSSLFDLLPLQHVNSTIRSLVLSHVNNYGTGVWWTRGGSNFDIEDLKGGFTLLKGGTEAPVGLPPPPLPDYLGEIAKETVQTMEALSGVNAVRRGTLVNEKAMSGAALALVDAKALEFAAGLQRANVRFLEGMASKTIKHYQRFGKAKMVALIAGKSNRSKLRDFIGEQDLPDIDRVTVDIGSPLSRTVSGRMSIAQMYLDMGPAGPIKTAEQIDQVLNTGKLEPAVESTRSRLANIRSENEWLQDGRPVRACATDNHPTHIIEHLTVIDSPEARQPVAMDPMTGLPTPESQRVQAVMENALAHVQEHVEMWHTTDPAILAAVGCPPPPAMPMMTQPGAPGATSSTPPPKGGVPSDSVGAPAGAGGQPQMPQMPMNNELNERAPVPQPPV